MKYILATTYDMFGYLIPGIVATLGLCLLAGVQGLFDATDWSAVTATGWTVILFACYVAGLLLQAGSNLVSRLLGSRGEDAVITNKESIDQEILAKAQQNVSALIPGVQTKGFWRICEAVVQLTSKSEPLDIYIYRVGLYRGLIGATALLCAGLLRQLLSGKSLAIPLGAIEIELGNLALSIMAVATLLGCVAAFYRYRSFCGYRVRYSIYHVAFHTNLAAEFTDDAGNGKPSQR